MTDPPPTWLLAVFTAIGVGFVWLVFTFDAALERTHRLIDQARSHTKLE